MQLELNKTEVIKTSNKKRAKNIRFCTKEVIESITVRIRFKKLLNKKEI